MADPVAWAMSWREIHMLAIQLSERVAADAYPDLIVGIVRGGLVPAVLVAHALDSRSVRTLEVTHTTSDAVNAEKTSKPLVAIPYTLGELAGLDVLVVDDVVGTGETIVTAAGLVAAAGARCVRTLACVVNETSWYRGRTDKPDDVLTYIGVAVDGWVIFPWEKQ